jgi:hypothetical protein
MCSQSKIILGHNPIYSEWIGVELFAEMKPSTKLNELKKIALQNLIDLHDTIIYNDWESFNKLLIKYTGYKLLDNIDNI